MDFNDHYLRVAEVAKILDRDISQVYRYIRENRLPAIKARDGKRVPVAALNAFIARERKVRVTYGRR